MAISPVSIPAMAHVERLIRRARDPQGFEEEELLAAASGEQIKEEREGENVFFKFLDYLARPQRAVAGVLKDAIDGGDFSPLDRVGQAIMGKERYHIKDVIDVIDPSVWSRLKLPEWMGGKEIDPLKEGIGFVGDVITDPLFQLPMFKMLGNVSRIGRGEAAFGKEIMHRLKDKPIVREKFQTAFRDRPAGEIQKRMETIGAVEQSVAGVIAQQKTARFAKDLFYQASKDPEEFAKLFDNAADREWFMERMVGGAKDASGRAIRGFVEGGRKYAAPSVAQRFEEGDQALFAFSANILGKKIGIPEVGLTGAVDRKYTSAVLKGIDDMMERVGVLPGVSDMTRMVKSMFRYGTGDDAIDGEVMKIMGKNAADENEVRVVVERLYEDVFKSRYPDPDFRQKVVESFENYTDMFGQRRRMMWQESPEVMEAVEKLRTIWRRYGIKEQERGMTSGLLTEGFLDPQQALIMSQKVIAKKGLKARATRAGSYSFITKTHMKDFARNVKKNFESKMKQVAGGTYIPAAKLMTSTERRAIKRDLWQQEVKDYLDIAAEQAATTVPISPVNGYFKREFTDEAKRIMDGMLGRDDLIYRGQKAHAHWLASSMGRKFSDMTIFEINDLIERGKLGHDFFDSVFSHARKSIRNRADKKAMKKLMEGAGIENIHLFFADDPLGNLITDIARRSRAITNHDAITQMIFYGGREIKAAEDLLPGEKLYTLSPQAMKSVYGDSVSAPLQRTFKAMADRKRAEGATKELTDIFVEADKWTIQEHVRDGFTMWALPAPLAKEINKRVSTTNSPEFWQTFLKGYDEITNWWKGSVLALFPGYFNRNAITNFVHSAVAGAFNPKAYYKAFEFIKAAGYHRENPVWGKLLGRKPTLSKPSMALDEIKWAGYTGNELHEMIQNLGVRGRGITGRTTEVKRARRQFLEGTGSKVAKGVFLHHEGVPIKAGFAVGHAIEEWQRVAHFLAELEKGLLPMEAKMSVNKYLFDFGEFTGFEKSVMKRAMPFYSWSRRNIPLWAELAVRRPNAFSQLQRFIEAFQSEEVQKMDRKILPSWANKAFGIPLKVDKATGDVKVSILQNWLSMADLAHVMRENPIHGLAMHGVEALHPVPKTILEKITNQSFYSKQPIEEFPGEPYLTRWPTPGGPRLSKDWVHTLKGVLPHGRLMSELHKLTTAETPQGKTELWTRIGNFLSFSPKIKSFDVEKLRKRYEFDVNIRKSKLKRLLNSAKRWGDKETIRYLKDLWKDAAGDLN